MVVVDARIDDGHHHALACIAQVPYLVGVHLSNIRGNLTGRVGRCGLFPIGKPVALFVQADDQNIGTVGKGKNGVPSRLKIDGVGNP